MDTIREWWAIAVAAVGFIIWLVRLEAGMLSNRKDIRRIEEDRKDDKREAAHRFDKVDARLDDANSALQQILILMNSKEDRK